MSQEFLDLLDHSFQLLNLLLGLLGIELLLGLHPLLDAFMSLHQVEDNSWDAHVSGDHGHGDLLHFGQLTRPLVLLGLGFLDALGGIVLLKLEVQSEDDGDWLHLVLGFLLHEDLWDPLHLHPLLEKGDDCLLDALVGAVALSVEDMGITTLKSLGNDPTKVILKFLIDNNLVQHFTWRPCEASQPS